MSGSWFTTKPLIGLLIGAISGLLIALGLGVILPWKPSATLENKSTSSAVSERMYKAPNLTGFVDQYGHKITKKAFDHKMLVVTFMYPSCQYRCPELASTMSNLSRILYNRNLQNKVELITINLDPDNSNKTEEKAFLHQYGYRPQFTKWAFLSSNAKITKQIITKGFHVPYQISKINDQKSNENKYNNGQFRIKINNILADYNNKHYLYNYNNPIILIGRNGYVRAMLSDGETISSAVLTNDIVSILKKSG